ncbi:hypothetical protein BN2476_1380024 [Paraburkholderia piptadeniae]|uniref:Uncharacterized protein n=1 Tax=Paraburkholderia piptadeniae TaxID=1701573 RepID=A0A1N7SWH0_9BURK|nr:hypothetical protein BN2476_1380024 [Paraburkholderia piptadeniae]
MGEAVPDQTCQSVVVGGEPCAARGVLRSHQPPCQAEPQGQRAQRAQREVVVQAAPAGARGLARDEFVQFMFGARGQPGVVIAGNQVRSGGHIGGARPRGPEIILVNQSLGRILSSSS